MQVLASEGQTDTNTAVTPPAVRLPPQAQPTVVSHPATCHAERARVQASLPATRPPFEWLRIWPFLLMQACCLLVFVVGWSPIALVVCAALYAVRMFGITAWYHRYFSHRSFETGRGMQFVGALLGAMATQRGPLWWAAHHRKHHRTSDTHEDAHSPVAHGLLWSHIGWISSSRNLPTDMSQVPDLAKYPELRWLDRHDLVVPFLLLASLLALGGVLEAYAPELGTSALQMGVWGFCVSTTLLFHATACINSLCHVFGRRRYPTKDQSRNSMLLALITFGEGWHNNHHWCPGTVRQGFRWWEIDLSWYGLVVLSWLGLVKLRPLPARVRAPRKAA
ncbi:MAG: acyl-CoA desaturase [Planctomycetes bacterium]|nr:acyl-CoA desaturase [Planctomycetota bacterium]MCB9886758.1 acyl-CoA desaturase [Planctomycetota bacterium]